DEDVRGTRRTVDEIPGTEEPLFTLDEEPALPGKDEEVLVQRLRVVEAVRLARVHYGDVDAELAERKLVRLEHRPRAERLRHPPLGISDVDDEPAFARGNEAGAGIRERCSRHRPSLCVRLLRVPTAELVLDALRVEAAGGEEDVAVEPEVGELLDQALVALSARRDHSPGAFLPDLT